MKNSLPFVLAAAVFAIFAIPAQAEQVRHYFDISGGKTPVTIKWKNISGLDSVRGTIYYMGGEMSFTGSNYASGKLKLNTETGLVIYLAKQNYKNSFAWVGKDMKLVPTAKGGYAALDPDKRPGNLDNNPSDNANANTTRRSYWATEAGGARFSTTINWHNIKGLGDIDGHFDVEGNRTSFSGRNSESGYIWFKDTSGNRYDLWKKNSAGKVNWSGSVTTPTGKEFTFSMTSK